MSESCTITTAKRTPRAVVLRVRGRLDARTSPQLVERCGAERPKAGHALLNLSEVSFLSSAGVGALLALAEKARADGGTLRLAPLSAPVQAVLDVLNLGSFLTVHRSEDEGLAALEAA